MQWISSTYQLQHTLCKHGCHTVLDMFRLCTIRSCPGIKHIASPHYISQYTIGLFYSIFLTMEYERFSTSTRTNPAAATADITTSDTADEQTNWQPGADITCPNCCRSAVLRDVCKCVDSSHTQRHGRQTNDDTKIYCDCEMGCDCRSCKPWLNSARAQASRARAALERYQAFSEAQQQDLWRAQQPASDTGFIPRRQHSFTNTIPIQQAAPLHGTDPSNQWKRDRQRRRTISASVAGENRVFMKHTRCCECRGSGVGCQCGRFCYCGESSL
jgi:hypothetical protein